jgi:hypothetical protein
MSRHQSDQPRRLPKKAGGRVAVTIRMPPERYAELVMAAKHQSRTISNMAMLRYEQGCQNNN